MSFVPLHVHSQYSILDSTIGIKPLVQKAKEFNLSSIALTDSGNLFGAVDFYKECKASGIKAIFGCEVRMAPTSRLEKKRIPNMPTSAPIVLLVKNEIGYRNLCKISSIGHIEGFYYFPRIDKEILEKYKEGLVCLSGPVNSPIGHALLGKDEEKAIDEILWYKNVFGDDFYLEVQKHPITQEDLSVLQKEAWVLQKAEEFATKEEKYLEKIKEYSQKHGIKCVATNDIHYLQKEDWSAHEILLNVQSGEPCEIWERDSRGVAQFKIPNPKRKTYPVPEFYFKSYEEMKELFQDFPTALENTLEIAEKCNFDLDFKTKHYPVFFPPSISEEEKEKISVEQREKIVSDYLYELCEKNIENRYPKEALDAIKNKHPEKDPMEMVLERFELEFKIISEKNLCDYLLIVSDFISWAKSKNIPVGPGRGSAAGSLLAYLLGITEIEPIRFDLFFERFINPERMSYPDIDVDICMERRQEVIDYTINKYGKERVAQIITFGTMKAKMAIKDVGRVLSVSLSKVNDIAKAIPEDLNMTIDKALTIDPDLKEMYASDEEAKRIIDIARKIEGSIRNTSIHAAGIIISAKVITDHVPVCVAKDSDMLVTQFSMKPVESVGMLKVDFLGLKTLTSIQKAVALVEKNFNKKIEWSSLPLDDTPTFDLLNKGKTLGVFQLESGGMQELARNLHIDRFEEILAVCALYRPGPMDMIPSFINRKHKREEIEIDHPLMEGILAETYGVMVYQEQVMQIANKLAGYSLGEGDVLRKAMGKKDKQEMARQREKFVKGSVKNGIEESVAIGIFDKIEKFASYGFNKSHSAGYGYLSYVTAYLKANYPKEWMAALMTCDKDDISKVSKFIRECFSMRIEILPPDVNEAGKEFVSTKDGIRFAMSGIKGIGEGVVDAIIEERQKKLYKSMSDFVDRIDKKKVGKKNIEVLIDAGALDFTSWPRDAMKENFESLYDIAVKEQKEKQKGILDFFSILDEAKEEQEMEVPKVKNPTPPLDILQKEKELLGFYLTAHPMDGYKSILKRLSCVPLGQLEKEDDAKLCRCSFIIDSLKVKISSKTQRKFAIVVISDGLDRYELPIWPELFEKNVELLQENKLIYAILKVDKRDNNFRLQCIWLNDLTKINEEMIRECDEVYDKMQKQAKFTAKYQYTKKVKKEEKSVINVNLDADVIGFSKILEIKKICLENRGSELLQLHFFSGNVKIGSIILDALYGIKMEENVKEKISNLLGVKEIEVK